MTNFLLNRAMVAIKTNKSGGSHAQGDICVEDTANANAVVNNTAGAYKDGSIWVCLEPNGVANNVSGVYANMGAVPKLNLSGTGSIGDLVKTHTVAKQGIRHASPFVSGDFAQVWGTSASPAAWLFGTPVQVGSGDVPSIVQDWKASVRVATTANITLSGEQTIDGVSVVAGDRVLVKDQSTGANNGIYVCASGAWSRATDADASSEVSANMAVAVEEGTANADKIFILTTNDPITLGSTALTFTSLGSSGAPTDAEYLATAANGTLSAEVVIPGLAGSPDRSGIGGGGTSEEYDTSTTGITWDSTPATVDSDTTVLSHLYIRHTGTTDVYGTKAWAPAGAFEVIAKVAIGCETTNNQNHQIGLHIQNSDNSNRMLLQVSVNPSTRACVVNAHTYASGSYTQRGSDWSNLGYAGRYLYFKATRDGSNNVSFYFSLNGLSWMFIGSASFTFTVAKLGYRVAGGAGSGAFQSIVDFLRTSV